MPQHTKKRSIEVEWTPRDKWTLVLFYIRFGIYQWCTYQVVETRKGDAFGNVVTGQALQSFQILKVVPAEHCVTFDEERALMHIEEGEREDYLPPPNNVIENIPAVDADTEDHWDLWDIPPLAMIDA